MAKQLLQALQQVADIAPAFLEKGYTLKIISSDRFTLTNEKNGIHFSSAELRPNGWDCLEQFREVVGRARAQEPTAQP